MSSRSRSKLLAVICILAIALPASRAAAETTAPVPGQSALPSLAPAARAETTQGTDCNNPKSRLTQAGGASVVQAIGESLQHKSWQPKGGELQFTVRSFVTIPANASVIVCFRWKSEEGGKNSADRDKDFVEWRPSRLDLSSDGKLLKVTTTIPYDLGPWPDKVATALPLVPLADVRILAINNQGERVADVTTAVGITYPLAGVFFAIVTIIFGFAVLYIAARQRLTQPGILKASWLLRIISTPSGYASLSQLQILLWTFVVAVSAVYVMALSGDLVEITNGTLILLGIAGAAGIAAKAHTEAQSSTAEAAAVKAAAEKDKADIIAAEKKAAALAVAAGADPVAAARIAAEQNSAARDAAAKATIARDTRMRADAMKDPPATQIPRWSDLFVSESGKDGTGTREIDVARFQMLLFTGISAGFVLMSVVTTYVIPEISTGFVTLMGISNGVYVGSKITQSS